MSKVEILAIIGIIGTFTVPFLAVLYQKRLNERRYDKIGLKRKKAISGRWTGNFTQENLKGNKNIKGTIDGDLYVKGKLIKGRMKIENKTHKTKPSFIVKGGFQNDRFIVLKYENEKNEIIQFGRIILELSAKTDRLTGKFVSYGAESEEIINGQIEITKV